MESRQGVCSAYERERAAQIACIGGNRKVGECITHAALSGHCNVNDVLVLIGYCTCCRHAGHSRVEYIQKHYLFLHAWKRGEAIRFTKRITLYSRQWSSWQLGRPAHCNYCVVQTSSMLPYTRLCIRCLRSWQSFTLLHSFSLVCCGGVYFGESLMLWHHAGSNEAHVTIKAHC